MCTYTHTERAHMQTHPRTHTCAHTHTEHTRMQTPHTRAHGTHMYGDTHTHDHTQAHPTARLHTHIPSGCHEGQENHRPVHEKWIVLLLANVSETNSYFLMVCNESDRVFQLQWNLD